jgi:diadenylate cyclase
LPDMDVVQWQNIVDFVVLLLSLYVAIRWAKTARAMRITLAIAALHSLALLADSLDLALTGRLLHGATLVAALMLIVVFQRELRNAFLQLNSRLTGYFGNSGKDSSEYRMIAEAVFSLTKTGTGALIVLLRSQDVGELTNAGVRVDADLSAGLLESVFQKTSPLHDGAVIIEGRRITRANVVLPLTSGESIPDRFGTRHRAAMGLAEDTDALVVTASEETGEVRMFSGTRVQGFATAKELEAVLQLYHQKEAQAATHRLWRFGVEHWDAKIAALVFALVIYGLPYTNPENAVRNVEVPIAFTNVPAGLVVESPVDRDLRVRIRGRRWRMENLNYDALIARIDMRQAQPGDHNLAVDSGALSLPPGIVVEDITPGTVYIRVTKRE